MSSASLAFSSLFEKENCLLLNNSFSATCRDCFARLKLFFKSVSSICINKSPELILSLLFTIIFLTTPSNGAVINLGLLGTTSTGAVLVILIGITKINIMDKIMIHDRLPVKFFFKKSLIEKSVKKVL